MPVETQQALVRYEPPQGPLAALEQTWRRVDIGKGPVVEVEQDWSRGVLGGAVWLASIALARYVASRRLEGLAVLELGAGAGGLPSIAAARAGAASVQATDGDAAVLPLLERNLARNSPLPADARKLRWGGELAQDPDLILAADAVYGGTREAWKPFLETCRRAPRVLLAHTHRYPDDDAAFFALATAMRFDVAELSRGVQSSASDEEDDVAVLGVAVYELRPRRRVA